MHQVYFVHFWSNNHGKGFGVFMYIFYIYWNVNKKKVFLIDWHIFYEKMSCLLK